QGGSKRMRHLYIRAGYLGLTIIVLLFVLLTQLGGSGSMSLRNLASSGANMFDMISYLQVGLICILTPVFMAGAIAQEANPQTWDILLTTPLNNLQVVLGNLFGRLFFVIALLFSSLPLFAVTQYFGGVPGDSIFASYAIAGSSALLVAAIAVTLSVTRTAGRRAVFVFYICVILYLFLTYAVDIRWRQSFPVAAGSSADYTTAITPLNPFLALEVLLRSNTYVPRDVIDFADYPWPVKVWFTQPIKSFCWLCVLISLFLIGFSTIRLRVIGARVGAAPWYRRIFGLGVKGAAERPPRSVSRNPIAWRESAARGKTFLALLARWGFVGVGVVIALVLVTMYHTGLWSAADLKLAVTSVVAAEIVIITLAALNMSATAVSREREDGTLDLILTTPIQPGPYLAGKLRGLIQFLLPMIIVPLATLAILSFYVLSDGLGQGNVMLSTPLVTTTNAVTLPIVFPEGVLAMAIMLPPFIAFCVMVGLQWSIKSRGTIGSVIMAVFIVIAIVGVLSLCGMASGGNMDVVGGVINTWSPINLLFAIVYPGNTIPSAFTRSVAAGRISLIIGAMIAAVAYSALVYGMHSNMKRTFMMTVRRLAGQA
ncbi:MAG: ABC transporter permease, partial [Phycisphaerales bacterium]|nr:ABC transporter permease [Phycisphaerales bacterium]